MVIASAKLVTIIFGNKKELTYLPKIENKANAIGNVEFYPD